MLYKQFSTLSAKGLPPKPGVYEIVCLPTGQRYIGGTSNLQVRVRHHRHKARAKAHNLKFNAAWAEYGEYAFTMRPIELTDDWKEREHFHRYQAALSGEDLLNMDTDIAASVRHMTRQDTVPAPAKKQRKLSPDAVIDIFTSQDPPKVLMLRYGVTHSMISHIRHLNRHQDVIVSAGLV